MARDAQTYNTAELLFIHKRIVLGWLQLFAALAIVDANEDDELWMDFRKRIGRVE